MIPASPAMPISLSAGGGGPSGAESNAGIQTPTNTPFNFDNSGWVVNFGAGNKVSAGGNSDANASTQTPSGAGGGLFAGIDNNMLLIGAVVLLLLMRRQ